MPLRRLEFSPRADLDLDDVFDYTVLNWGTEQATQYRKELFRALMQLRQFPHIGRDRSEIHDQLHSFVIGHHVAFYRVFDDRVLVSRIIHEREDAAEALADLEELR